MLLALLSFFTFKNVTAIVRYINGNATTIPIQVKSNNVPIKVESNNAPQTEIIR